jgi:trans-2,3-dihydro-3-hydroxyanthranilate isomerase
MSSHAFAIVDVFTDRALTGNQLGIFADAAEIDEAYYQPLAKELGFAETVFVLPAERDSTARIRIFTPATELPFAGHPVLGTAIYVGGREGVDAVSLETGAGVIPITLEGASRGRMTQPVPEWSTFADAPALLEALGLERSELPVEAYAIGPEPVFVTLRSPAELAALQPDLARLTAFANTVSCIAPDRDRWKARVFAPGHGVPEDSATGSSAGPLALHLARHGRIAFGEQIEIHQGGEIGRPSVLFAAAYGSSDSVDRIEVSGSAVVVAEGAFRLG